MKNITRNVLLISACFTSAAYAGTQAESGGGGFLLTLFLGFLALIVVFQLIPAVFLFVSLIRGMFGKKDVSTVVESVNGKAP